jgi:hypothetical protein
MPLAEREWPDLVQVTHGCLGGNCTRRLHFEQLPGHVRESGPHVSPERLQTLVGTGVIDNVHESLDAVLLLGQWDFALVKERSLSTDAMH